MFVCVYVCVQCKKKWSKHYYFSPFIILIYALNNHLKKNNNNIFVCIPIRFCRYFHKNFLVYCK